MRLNLNTSDLDWANPNILDYRYVYHLMLMVNERWTMLGISSVGFDKLKFTPSFSSNKRNFLAFQMNRYSPNGILTWDQLSSIYHGMVYLGLYVYLNPNNFNESNWKNGENRKLFNYSLTDMCEIAGFDFFANPFIPGQPLKYYEKFLLPIKKVLSEYKKINNSSWYVLKNNANMFCAQYEQSYDSFFPLPGSAENPPSKTEILEYLKNKENWISKLKEYYLADKNSWNKPLPKSSGRCNHAILGYQYYVRTLYLRDSNDDIFSDLVITAAGVNAGNYFKCSCAAPSGTPYEIYLCHTTFNTHNLAENKEFSEDLMMSYFNSPWPMIIPVKQGVVNESEMICEKLEISIDEIPFTHEHSIFGEKYDLKYIKENGYVTEERNTNYYKKTDVYSAYYYPMIVFDFSNRFKYL